MISRKAIIKKKFARVFYGYDEREVDEFLDEIILEFDRLGDEHETLEKKLRQAIASRNFGARWDRSGQRTFANYSKESRDRDLAADIRQLGVYID